MMGWGALVENVLVRAWYVDSQGVVVMISMGACLSENTDYYFFLPFFFVKPL